MALVVLLRGINVGGHRTFRPSALAKQLKHLDAVNIGAAGTFVIRRPITTAQLRADLARMLPFDAEIVICQGREIVRMMSHNHFVDQPLRPEIVRFVSVLSRRARSVPSMPITLPPSGAWLLKILARDRRFVFGLYRRHMKVISYLGTLDRLFGVPVTTRNWNTITAIAGVLGGREEGKIMSRVRMDADDFRRMALGMRGAVESAHMGHPDFRVNNRIFATLHHDPEFGMVNLTPEQQAQFVSGHAGAFAPESGAWGRAGSTRVRLAAVDEETLGEALTLAWQNISDKSSSTRKRRRT